MSMGLRKGPMLPIAQTNHPYKFLVKIREVQLSSAHSDDCRRGVCPRWFVSTTRTSLFNGYCVTPFPQWTTHDRRHNRFK